MEKRYVIKNNLPLRYMQPRQYFATKEEAKKSFLFTYEVLSSMHTCKMFIRDERQKPLRGSMQIEIDGFFYYIELYKEQK